jgi:hypothetical protein
MNLSDECLEYIRRTVWTTVERPDFSYYTAQHSEKDPEYTYEVQKAITEPLYVGLFTGHIRSSLKHFMFKKAFPGYYNTK